MVINQCFASIAMEVATSKDRFLPSMKQVTYQEINQVLFTLRFIKRVKVVNDGVKMSKIDFKSICKRAG